MMMSSSIPNSNLVFVWGMIAVFFFMACGVDSSDSQVLDVTKYGAKPNSDISQALLDAWKDAIVANSSTTIVIPKGTWSLTQVKLLGPNKSPVTLKVEGEVKAPLDPNAMPDKGGEWITINYVNYLTITGGGVFDGQGQEAWKRNDCHKNQKCVKLPLNLSFNFVNNTVIQDVTTKDSKNFHLNVIGCYNVSFVRFTVSAPGDSPNTDGIHLGRSQLISITDTDIRTGDDCISIGDGSEHVTVHNVHCGPGHGISIGSLGKYTTEKDVNGIEVTNCTFANTMAGVRIKTWPSAPARLKVTNVVYEDIVMENVTWPIVIDQEYCPFNQCKLDTPSLVTISNVKLNKIRGTFSDPKAVTLVCSGSNPCEHVEIGDIDLQYTGKAGNVTTKCGNVKPIFSGKQNPPFCATAAQSA